MVVKHSCDDINFFLFADTLSLPVALLNMYKQNRFQLGVCTRSPPGGAARAGHFFRKSLK